MFRPKPLGRVKARVGLALSLGALLFVAGASRAQPREASSTPTSAANLGSDYDFVIQPAKLAWARAERWYHRTPPADRVAWGGLAACAGLGAFVLLGRMFRLRPRKIVPHDFPARFLARLQDGKLDRGKALDFCELNPSPASRMALGVVRRWDRPVADQERALSMVLKIEAERLRRNVGTLRRIAAMAPLLGLLGTLMSIGRVLTQQQGANLAPALGVSLHTLTAGVALAILALVAYDGLTARVEWLLGRLEQVGMETIDAIAMNTPTEARGNRTPHSVRVEIPEPHARNVDRGAGYV